MYLPCYCLLPDSVSPSSHVPPCTASSVTRPTKIIFAAWICCSVIRTGLTQIGFQPNLKSLAASAQPISPVGPPQIVARWLQRKVAIPPKPSSVVFSHNPLPRYRKTSRSTGFPVRGDSETSDLLSQTLISMVSLLFGLPGEDVLFKTKPKDTYVFLANTGVKVAYTAKQRNLPAPLSFSGVDVGLQRKQKDIEVPLAEVFPPVGAGARPME